MRTYPQFDETNIQYFDQSESIPCRLYISQECKYA